MSGVELRHMSNKMKTSKLFLQSTSSSAVIQGPPCTTEKCKCDAHSASNSLFVRQSIHSRNDEYLIKPIDLASIQEQNRSGHDIQDSSTLILST